MEKVQETVKEHCRHKDCAHRGQIDGSSKFGDVCCDYILHEHEPRNCSISECNKYVSRKNYKQPSHAKWWW